MTKSRGLTCALGCALLLLGIAAPAHSQDAPGDYVAPSQAVPTGSAPHMQVQLLSNEDQTKEYGVILGKGDEVFSGLLAFAKIYHVTCAHFTAIGALSGATLAWFDPAHKMYNAALNMRLESVIANINRLSSGSFFQGEQLPLPAKSLAEAAGMPLENVDNLRHRGFATPVALQFTDIRNHGKRLRAGQNHALDGHVVSFRCGTSRGIRHDVNLITFRKRGQNEEGQTDFGPETCDDEFFAAGAFHPVHNPLIFP